MISERSLQWFQGGGYSDCRAVNPSSAGRVPLMLVATNSLTTNDSCQHPTTGIGESYSISNVVSSPSVVGTVPFNSP